MAILNSAIVGAAGEHYVPSQLLRRGWIAAIAHKQAEGKRLTYRRANEAAND